MAHSVALVGALGRMGERVRAALAAEAALSLGAALESPGHPGLGEKLDSGVTVSDDPVAAFAACPVAIDFSVPEATLAHLRVAARTGSAYVTGTTGFDAEQSAELQALAQRVPILHAANFSLAVNVLAWLVGQATRKLGPDYATEIVELHHAAKRDAPSGTALRLAEAIAAARGGSLQEQLVLERAGEIGARPEHAIGVQTLRGGDSAGEHSVYFLGSGERLELHHRASSRDHFARGAVRAATWLVGKPPGLYRVEHALGLAPGP
ncbi:MAG: 4-hydroxy-tetrahydrodipicolinate reductase [Myxococcota bacterium]